MVNSLKNLNWFLLCFVASVAYGLVHGFTYPQALALVGFLGLEVVVQLDKTKQQTKLDEVNELKERLSKVEENLVTIGKMGERVASAESKLALMNSTRRTM